MAELEVQKNALEARLAGRKNIKVQPHPNVARVYRELVVRLRED